MNQSLNQPECQRTRAAAALDITALALKQDATHMAFALRANDAETPGTQKFKLEGAGDCFVVMPNKNVETAAAGGAGTEEGRRPTVVPACVFHASWAAVPRDRGREFHAIAGG